MLRGEVRQGRNNSHTEDKKDDPIGKRFSTFQQACADRKEHSKNENQPEVSVKVLHQEAAPGIEAGLNDIPSGVPANFLIEG